MHYIKIFLVDVSDIFIFFCPGEGKGKSEAGRGGFIENPRSGGVLQGGGPRGREGLCGKFEIWEGGGLNFFFGAEMPTKYSRGINTVGPTIITLHEFIVPGLITELHYICSVRLN